MIKNLALALASSWLTLLGADAFLARTRWVPDTRGKLEVVAQLREKGVDAYPQVYGFLFAEDGGLSLDGKKIFPLSGVANKTVVYCNESGRWLVYDSDEHGFHNPRGLWAGERADIAIIGDSFANGACVPSDKNSAALIRRKYARTLTLGTGASSALYQLATIREYLGALKPKVVLWYFDEMNDIEDLLSERKNPVLMRYLDPGYGADLIHRQPEIDAALLRYVEKAVASYGAPWSRLTPAAQAACPICGASYYEAGRFTTAVEAETAPRLRRILDRLELVEIRKLVRGGWRAGQAAVSSGRTAAVASQAGAYDICKSQREAMKTTLPLLRRAWKAGGDEIRGWGGTTYIVYLPSEPSFRDPRIPAEDMRLHDEVVALARSLGFKVIDATEDFKAHPKPLSLWQGHYNDAGYGVVADAVLRALKDEPALR